MRGKIRLKGFSLLLAILLAVNFFSSMTFAQVTEINVRSFGAIPNDGQDDSVEIMAAVSQAISEGIGTIRFEAGVYDFKENPTGGVWQNAYMRVMNAKNLTIEGAADHNGAPLTKWVRLNTLENNADLRQLLFVGFSENITVKNIVIDNSPYYYSAGTIVSVQGNRVTVDVLEGHPCFDGMKANLPGVYDLKNKAFIEQRVVMTENDGSGAPVLYRTFGGSGKRLYVDNQAIADAVSRAIDQHGLSNVVLFWFQGNLPTSAQMLMNYSVKGLTYENVSILNATGFALTSDFCRDITYKNVRLAPEGNRVAAAPRDGFKVCNSGGFVLMDGIYIDGICDDGQNCHGLLTTINKKINDNTLLTNGYPWGNFEIPAGSKIRLLSAGTNEYYFTGTIKSAGTLNADGFLIETEEKLPDDIVFSPDKSTQNKTVLEIDAFYPDSYTVRNSVIRNSYRGLKISQGNVKIYNNLFENNVYNLYAGAENDQWWVEGQHPENVEIYNNIFRNPLSGISVDIDFHSFPSTQKTPVMSNISIHGNQFFDSKTAVSVKDLKDSFIYGNTFTNCEKELDIEALSTKNLVFEDPALSRPADLVMTELRTNPALLAEDADAGFYAIVRNTGAFATPPGEPVEVSFYVDGMLLEKVKYNNQIKAGSMAVIPVSASWRTWFGSHTCRAIIGKNISETNYKNNELKIRFKVN